MIQLPNGDQLFEVWLLGTKLVIFQLFSKKHGWEVYTAGFSHKTEETFAELKAFCQLTDEDWRE